MNHWELSKQSIVKEELLCKNECEVIIDEVEDGTDFNLNMNCSYYCNNKLPNVEKTNKNYLENVVVKKQRPQLIMRFGCMVCSYKTANSTNFKIHLRTHTGEKPYKCELCPYRAKVLCALYRHKRVHTGERPYACDLCSYRAAQPSHLVRHKMVHTGERPHSCELCSYRASQMSHLVRHMTVHTNYRPFPCNHCSYRAKRKSHLQKHLGTHEKERLFDVISSRQLRNANRRSLIVSDDEHTLDVSNSFICKFCNVDEPTLKNKQDNEEKLKDNRSNYSNPEDFKQQVDERKDNGLEQETTVNLEKQAEEIIDPLSIGDNN